MNLVFYGAQKENMDSAEFFCKLEELNVDYTVDCRTGEIGINNIEKPQRSQIVEKINQFYDVDYVVSRKKPMELTSFEFESDETRDVELNIELQFNKLREALLTQGLKESTIITCIKRMTSDIEAITECEKKIHVGEIVSCDFGFGVRGENNGKLWVVVLQKTINQKYLVVPIKFKNKKGCKDEFCLEIIKDIDVVYYNKVSERKTARLYLHKVQEVSSSRFTCNREGKVTKRFLKKIYDSLSLMKEEDLSLREELEDLVQVAVWHCAKKETVPEQAEYLFEVMQIPQEYIFLRSALSIALSTKITVLKTIVSMIGEDHEYSSYKIKTRLREEFVTWFKQLYPDVFEKYEKISLADFLKAILKMLEERKK